MFRITEKKKIVHAPSLLGVVYETRPGSGKLQSLRELGSKVRGGADGVVSQCTDCGVAMLREAGPIQKMEPNEEAGEGIRMGQECRLDEHKGAGRRWSRVKWGQSAARPDSGYSF